jgi:hypothetical protein
MNLELPIEVLDELLSCIMHAGFRLPVPSICASQKPIRIFPLLSDFRQLWDDSIQKLKFANPIVGVHHVKNA